MTRVLRHSDLRCPTTGKTAYVNRETCEEEVEYAKTSPTWDVERHGRRPERAYQCDHCGWWHMTAKAAGWERVTQEEIDNWEGPSARSSTG